MHDQRLAVVEIGDEIFGAPAKVENPSALKTRGKALRKGNTQIMAPQFDARDRRADERRGQSAPHRFDFGQFGHNSGSSRHKSRRAGAARA